MTEKEMAKLSRLIARARKSPKGFLNSICVILEKAYDLQYAKKQMETACDILISLGMCSGCKDCTHCQVQRTFNETQDIILHHPEVVELRRRARQAEIAVHERHQYVDKNGHKCETWRSNKF